MSIPTTMIIGMWYVNCKLFIWLNRVIIAWKRKVEGMWGRFKCERMTAACGATSVARRF